MLKMRQAKGITLITVVVSIIVLLIISGISVNLVVGDNGLLERAKDAKLLTDLADDLFEMESDMVNIRVGQLGRKLKISEVVDGLIKYAPEKYNVSEMVGMHTSDILLSNTKTNPRISYSGNVFINDYIRGKIQLADIINTEELHSSEYGDFTMTVNDGSISYNEDEGECTIHSLEDHPVLWVNQDSQIMAFASHLSFNPYGLLENYEISSLDVFNIDSAYETVKSMCDNKYVFNMTFDYRKEVDEEKYIVEAFGFYFTENVEFSSGERTIRMGGMNVERGGIVFAKTKEELEDIIEELKSYNDTIPAAMINNPEYSMSFRQNGTFDSANKTGVFDCGDNAKIVSWLYEFSKDDFGIDSDTTRIYYTPFILYEKYVQEESGEWVYSPLLSVGIASYIGSIAFE